MLLCGLGAAMCLAADSRAQDSDGDGVPDVDDQCLGTPAGFAVDAGGCRQKGLFRVQTTGGSVYYLQVYGELLQPQSSDFSFQSYTRISSPGTEDAIQILFSLGGSSEVAWARPYSDGTIQLWDKGDHLTYGSSAGRQHDVEGGPTTPGAIVTSPACAPYEGVTITVTMIADADGDGVPDDADLCPGTPPGAVVDGDGCCKATEIAPVNGYQFADANAVLIWSPCGAAVADRVYFGTDYAQVLNATPADVGADMVDLDGSGRVDLGDVVLMSLQWLTYPAGAGTSADFTGDGFVDSDDYKELAELWQTSYPSIYKGSVTNATYDPGPLTDGTTYYWRIDGVNDPHVFTGDIWSFKIDELVVFPEDYGAAGDGVIDDTDAFYAAAQAIADNDGGVLRLMPNKTYCIGKQVHVPDQYPYYQPRPMITIQNAQRRVLIDGQGSTLRTNDGLRFGTFDKDTGEPYYPDMPFYDGNYNVGIGTMIYLAHCARVEIRDIVLDGNMDNLVVGGYWGDTGRQCSATGIHLSSNDSATVMNVISSHHGLDGVIVSDPGALAGDPCTPVYLKNVECYYNARQGLSWVGGVGLKAENCKFAHTGKGRFVSAPGAGVDIEAEDAVNREGRFINCDFVNNASTGLVADSGDSANCTFTDCLFWGATSWSLWPNKPGFKFYNCDIYGTMVAVYGSSDPNQAAQFYNCRFEDYEGTWDGTPLGVHRSAGLYEGGGENIRFDGCTFVANQIRALYIDYGNNHEIMTNCAVYHKHDGLGAGDFQSLLRGVVIDNTHFYEDLPGLELYYIAAQSVCVGPNVVVDGPQCKWNGSLTGTIPQGGCD